MIFRLRLSVIPLAVLLMSTGCNFDGGTIVIVQGCSVKSLDKKAVDLVLLTARGNGWSSVQLEELPSNRDGERMLSIEPIRQGSERFGDSHTIVIRDGKITEEHLGR